MMQYKGYSGRVEYVRINRRGHPRRGVRGGRSDNLRGAGRPSYPGSTLNRFVLCSLFQLFTDDPAQGAFQVISAYRLLQGFIDKSLIATIPSLSLEPGHDLRVKHDIDPLFPARALGDCRLPFFLCGGIRP